MNDKVNDVRRKMRNLIAEHEPDAMQLLDVVFRAQDNLWSHMSTCKTCESALMTAVATGITDGGLVQYCDEAKDLFKRANHAEAVFNVVFPPIESERM